MRLFWNVLKDVDVIEYEFAPLHFNRKAQILESIKAPKGDKCNEDWMNESIIIEQSAKLLPLVRRFPGRMVKGVKIELNGEGLLIFDADYSFLQNGWYGMTILKARKEELPVNQELQLSSEVYETINDYLLEKNTTDLKSAVQKKIENYKKSQVVSCFNKARKKQGEKYFLEDIIEPTETASSKWDVFLIHKTGEPVADIYRVIKDYSNGANEFIKLDMKRKYDLPGYDKEMELTKIHILNCMALSAAYTLCGKVGNLMGYEHAKLRHTTTKLHKNLGYGFTFLEHAVINGKEVIFCLDVKNKLTPGNKKHINKLFGNERKTLKKIKQQIVKSDSLKESKVRKSIRKALK
ncbi:MAG: hypothetical protein ACOC44_14850 [Promethearchaeia archaeon]